MTFSLFNISQLENALDACAFRNTVLANNIANANTPGYTARAAAFSHELRDAFKSKSKRKKPKLTVVDKGTPVDIISEMVNLSKNQILYHAYADRVSHHFRNLNWILDNAGR